MRRLDLQAKTSVNLDGPSSCINGVQYVEALKGIFTYGENRELSFDGCPSGGLSGGFSVGRSGGPGGLSRR